MTYASHTQKSSARMKPTATVPRSTIPYHAESCLTN